MAVLKITKFFRKFRMGELERLCNTDFNHTSQGLLLAAQELFIYCHFIHFLITSNFCFFH